MKTARSLSPTTRTEALWLRHLQTLRRFRALIVLAGLTGGWAGLAYAHSLPQEYRAVVQLEYREVPTDPEDARADAERDIAAREFRFLKVGGFCTSFPGIPKGYDYIVHRYPQGVAGVLGCFGGTSDNSEYARRYNERMLSHLLY